MNANVRFLTQKDLETLSEKEQQVLFEKIARFCAEMQRNLRGETLESSMRELSKPDSARYLLLNGRGFALAMNRGKLVGLSNFGPIFRKTLFVHFVAVSPIHERSGIGTKLLLACSSYARRQNVQMEMEFRSPEGRGLGRRIINLPRRKVYKKGKPVHWAEEYDVAPEMGNIRVNARTATPIRPPSATKSLWRQLRTRWKMKQRGRK